MGFVLGTEAAIGIAEAIEAGEAASGAAEAGEVISLQGLKLAQKLEKLLEKH